MNILVICTFFPPDSAVAAVRPYMFAKYLSRAGHHVTVLRSGEFFRQPDDSYDDLENVRIITYLGDDSPAEKYRRGIYDPRNVSNKKHYKKLPKGIRKTGRFFLEPRIAYKDIRSMKTKYEIMKSSINQLKDQEWDVVFSTYGELENILGGWYAAKLLHAKWIQDFRDPVVWFKNSEKYIWNIYARRIQKKAVRNADLCTAISEGLKEKLLRDSFSENIVTLYNGYEEKPTEEIDGIVNDPNHLKICYLGTLYSDSLRALEMILNCLRELADSGVVHLNRLKFIYGGSDEDEAKKVFAKCQMTAILESVGYVDRNTAHVIQQESDLFLVLAWNTKQSQGNISGKFYEGIRAGKPILAVVAGEVPKSELYKLNEKYHYGFCYEECRNDEHHALFLDYLREMYNEKIEKGEIAWEPNMDLVKTFRYDYLTCKLENIMKSLIENDVGQG